MGPIPGGTLEGPELPWPADWTFTDSLENILLETRLEDPYSVTLYGVYKEKNFYVVCVHERSRYIHCRIHKNIFNMIIPLYYKIENLTVCKT